MTQPAYQPTRRGVFRRLLGMLRSFRGRILLGLFLLLLSTPCELFPALVWKYVADDIVVGHATMPLLHRLVSLDGLISDRLTLLGSVLIWLVVVYVLGQALHAIHQNLLGRVAQRFIFQLRNQVYRKLQNQSLSWLQRQRTGDLMSRAMGDVEEVQTFVTSGIDVIIGESVLWLATVAVVFALDWRVAGVSLAPLICVAFMLRLFNRRIKPVYQLARERLGDVSTRLQENLSGVTVIKIFGREKQEERRFADATAAHRDAMVQAVNIRTTYFPIAQCVGFLSNVFMIGLGGYLILTEWGQPGAFTLGTLLAFRAYWWRLFGPIQTLGRVNDMVQRSIASSRRVFEVLDAPDELPDAPDARPLAHVRGEMELRNVSFRYVPEAGKPGPLVLIDVSLRIEPGSTVAICGPSGAGKSTIINLLLRFFDAESGTVLLDGRDIRTIQKESLRRHFALVQQESFLFNDSLLDNIRYGHPEATMEQVIAAAQAANAHGFISNMPRGYETRVGERGVRLSGGQRQRISIARAFLANPAVLLLDEPTSSVEPDSEATIIAALDRLMAGRTTVLTSHRPSLVNQADLVYVIEGGRVSESGPPAELAASGGWFSRFIRAGETPESDLMPQRSA